MNFQNKTKQELINALITSKQTEKDLRDSQGKLRSMIESIGEAVAVIDLEANIEGINGAMLKLYGFDRKEEIIGRNALQFVTSHDHDLVRTNINKTIREGHGGQVECTLLDKDGKSYEVENHAALLKDSEGIPFGIIVDLPPIIVPPSELELAA